MSRFRLSLFFFAVWAAAIRAVAAPADLLLIAPDDATLQPVLARLTETKTETVAAWTLWRGQLAGKTVVVTRSEGDPLNAVAATTLALRRYTPRLVVVFGLARAHYPALRAGDVVVSARFAAFDGMVSPHLELEGGSDALKWSKLPHLLLTPGEKETATEAFPADDAAGKLAATLTVASGRVVLGVLGSANQVNREADRIARLHAQWGTSCEDGESAHIAGCAALFGVPVVGFRVIGDAPDAREVIAAFTVRFMEGWK